MAKNCCLFFEGVAGWKTGPWHEGQARLIFSSLEWGSGRGGGAWKAARWGSAQHSWNWARTFPHMVLLKTE